MLGGSKGCGRESISGSKRSYVSVNSSQVNKVKTRGNRTDLKEGLNVYYTNSRNLRNKMDLLWGVNSEEKFDIIAITESWMDLDSKHFSTEFEISSSSSSSFNIRLFPMLGLDGICASSTVACL